MSKSALKNQLISLTKGQIIEQVLDLYDNCKPAKEYLEYFLNPNEKEMFEKYKVIIINEFYPKGKYVLPRTRFSVAKKAIADFRVLHSSPELLGDLMLTLVENACNFTFDYGDMSEQYYNSAYNNFKAVLQYLKKTDLLEHFKLRCVECLNWSKDCGYGFTDEMSQLFYDYYEED